MEVSNFLGREAIIERIIVKTEESLQLPKNWRNTRYRQYVDVRACLYNYLNKERRFTLSEIARAFDKNHASVINGIKNYQQLASDPEFREVDIKVKSILSGDNLLTLEQMHSKLSELESKVVELEAALNECQGSASRKEEE